MTNWQHLLKHASPDVRELNADVLDGKPPAPTVTVGSPQPIHRGNTTVIDSIKFDSRDEAIRYTVLRHEADAGIISELKCHPTFVVQESFRRDGIEYGAITYEADFSYMRDGYLFVEDVKGTKWNKNRTRKLFRIERDSKLRMKMFVKHCVDDKTIFRVVDRHGTSHPLKWK